MEILNKVQVGVWLQYFEFRVLEVLANATSAPVMPYLLGVKPRTLYTLFRYHGISGLGSRRGIVECRQLGHSDMAVWIIIVLDSESRSDVIPFIVFLSCSLNGRLSN
jgi:hypothetical protein